MVSYSLESNLNKQARMNIMNNLPRGESIAKKSYNPIKNKKNILQYDFILWTSGCLCLLFVSLGDLFATIILLKSKTNAFKAA